MKLVSFIIPVYNVASYVKRCLINLVTYILDNEIIIVNDGSTDSSQTIIDEFVSAYPSVVAIYQSNAGLSAARNIGLKYATGEYICFIDSDDYIDPQEFSHILKFLNNGIALPDIVIYGRVDEYTGWYMKSPKNLFYCSYPSGQDYFKKAIANGTFRTNAWDKLFRRKFIDDYGLRFVEGLLYEDMYFCLMAFMYSKTVLVLPYYPYHYIHYNTSSITSLIRKKDLDVLKYVHLAYDFISSGNFTINTQTKEFQVLIYNWVSSCLMNKYAYLSLRDKEAQEIFKTVISDNLFMSAVAYCSKNSVGVRQKFFSILLLHSHFAYKLMLHMALKMKKLKNKLSKKNDL